MKVLLWENRMLKGGEIEVMLEGFSWKIDFTRFRLRIWWQWGDYKKRRKSKSKELWLEIERGSEIGDIRRKTFVYVECISIDKILI